MGTSWGTAAGSLSAVSAGSWAAASVGQRDFGVRAEQLTGQLLDELVAYAECDVVHDVRVPGLSANLDHVLVGARRVVVVDAKWWKPGQYWTWRGTTRRGREVVKHVDSRSLVVARAKLARALPVQVVQARSVLVVWTSAGERMRLRWLRTRDDSRVISGVASNAADVAAVRAKLRRMLPQGAPHPGALGVLLALQHGEQG